MLGLIFLGLVGVGYVVESCREISHDSKNQDKARKNGNEYYIDSHGCFRCTSNNHKVMTNVLVDNGDRVDIDLKTGEHIRRIPDQNRVRRENWLKKCEEERRINKLEAIKKGEPFYLATVQVDDAYKYSMLPGHDIYLRVSDDLPLGKKYPTEYVKRIDPMTGICTGSDAVIAMRDYNLGLYVGKEKDYNESDYPLIDRWKKSNWYIINHPRLTGSARTGYIYDNGFFEQKNYETPEEKEEYARKIGAFL